MMKKESIHENLSTSFVDVEALVRHLRGLGFVGSVRIEMSSYDAEITFTHANLLLAREYDYNIGRPCEGEVVLQSILKRAKEPNGRITVYRAPEENYHDFAETIFVDESIAADAKRNADDRFSPHSKYYSTGDRRITQIATAPFRRSDEREAGLPKLPFVLQEVKGDESLANTVLDWKIRLDITNSLLQVLDEAFANANLSFTAVFQNACAINADRFPFLDHDLDVVSYSGGTLVSRRPIDPTFFSEGIFEALGRIFKRLREEARYGNFYHATSIKIRVLMQKHRRQFERLNLAEGFETLFRD